MCNPNLLINPDFKINQRGQSSYNVAAAYAVDGWKLDTDNTILTVVDDGIKISKKDNGSDTNARIIQTFETSGWRENDVLTVSCKLSNGKIVSASGKVNKSTQIAYSDDYVGMQVSYHLSKRLFTMRIRGVDDTIYPVAAKLELGEFSTLANEIVDHAAELRKCQRYFMRLNYNAYETVGTLTRGEKWTNLQLAIPTEMRIDNLTSTITCDLTQSNNGQKLPAPANTNARGATVNIGFNVSVGNNLSDYAYAGAAGYIDFSAEL